MSAQADDAVHPARHVRRARDLADLADFLDLEHIDAELLVAAQVEQQDLHLVGSRQIGARIDLVQQPVLRPRSTCLLHNSFHPPQPNSRVNVCASFCGSNFGTYSSTPTALPSCWLDELDKDECINTGMPAKRLSALILRVSM